MASKQELNARLSALAALQVKVTEGAFSGDETEILVELLEASQARDKETWLQERAEEAVSVLFPTWRGGRIEKPAHPMWHEKSWWWNGARVDSLDTLPNGNVRVDLVSYVGCGETDTIHGLVLKKEWLDADDMVDVLKAYREAEFERKEAQRRGAELARAQADLLAAQARLNEMNGA